MLFILQVSILSEQWESSESKKERKKKVAKQRNPSEERAKLAITRSPGKDQQVALPLEVIAHTCPADYPTTITPLYKMIQWLTSSSIRDICYINE